MFTITCVVVPEIKFGIVLKKYVNVLEGKLELGSFCLDAKPCDPDTNGDTKYRDTNNNCQLHRQCPPWGQMNVSKDDGAGACEVCQTNLLNNVDLSTKPVNAENADITSNVPSESCSWKCPSGYTGRLGPTKDSTVKNINPPFVLKIQEIQLEKI